MAGGSSRARTGTRSSLRSRYPRTSSLRLSTTLTRVPPASISSLLFWQLRSHLGFHFVCVVSLSSHGLLQRWEATVRRSEGTSTAARATNASSVSSSWRTTCPSCGPRTSPADSHAAVSAGTAHRTRTRAATPRLATSSPWRRTAITTCTSAPLAGCTASWRTLAAVYRTTALPPRPASPA